LNDSSAFVGRIEKGNICRRLVDLRLGDGSWSKHFSC